MLAQLVRTIYITTFLYNSPPFFILHMLRPQGRHKSSLITSEVFRRGLLWGYDMVGASDPVAR